MSKSLAASKQLMQTYLSELLTEETDGKTVTQVKEKQVQPLEKLLNQVSLPKLATDTEQINTDKSASRKELKTRVDTSPTEASNKIAADNIEAKVEQKLAAPVIAESKLNKKLATEKITTQKSAGGFEAIKQKSYREGSFQAMFFDVAGLLIAVPLIELGGIHNNDKTTALMGKPNWFKGVMLHRDEKVNVVDTALWVMPEKCNEKLISSLNYQYIIMLNDSSWGLTAEHLVDTVTLKQEDVKWLDSPSKRPWLAGLVKDRMCALLDVDSLIKLLEKGVNITQE